jgi:hypothetical protein
VWILRLRDQKSGISRGEACLALVRFLNRIAGLPACGRSARNDEVRDCGLLFDSAFCDDSFRDAEGGVPLIPDP